MRIQSFLLSAAAVICTLCLSSPALAGDVIKLKDGRTLEGTIVREESGIIWIKVASTGKEEIILSTQVQTIERDTGAANQPANPADAAKPDAPAPAAPAQPQAQPESRPAFKPGVPRAAIITLGNERENKGMVGMYMTAHALEQALPLLEEELGNDGSGVVIMRINSPGGYTIEVQRLSDIIHNEYKRRFRTVAWIDSAISAAAMTSFTFNEVYFTSQGNLGAATQFTGGGRASVGRDLEEVLSRMEKLSQRGGYNYILARAMQIQQPVSATRDKNDPTGRTVIYFPNYEDGDIKINAPGRVLTFNERTALEAGFSKGTADTLDELTKLLGYQELQWVGKDVKGVPWPVCKAEAWTLRYRDQVYSDEQNTRAYFNTYGMQIQAAQAAPAGQRGPFIARARDTLRKMERMVKNNPNFRIFVFNMLEEREFRDWIAEQEKILRDLAR